MGRRKKVTRIEDHVLELALCAVLRCTEAEAKDHIRTRGASLGEAPRHGFQRSMARYFGRAGRAAFNMATRGGGTWTEVQQRTHLGCSDDGVCSEDELTDELRTFVKDVEPVLDQMVKLQKSAGLEDPRTP